MIYTAEDELESRLKQELLTTDYALNFTENLIMPVLSEKKSYNLTSLENAGIMIEDFICRLMIKM